MSNEPRHRQDTQRVSRRSRIVVALVVVVTVALTVTGFSSATFTASTAATTGTVSSAADWTPPTVTLQSPGSLVMGGVTLTASALDADSGVKNVSFQYRAADQGAVWTTLCNDSTAPYTCALGTMSAPDGAYDLRVVATDVAGNTATSAIVRSVVDNTAPTVAMTNPGSPLSGTRTFTATAADATSGVARVVIEHSTGSGWSTLCDISEAPFTCTYDTTKLADGTYSLRAVATDKAGNATTSATVTNRVVSNVTSTVSLADPGTYLRGTVNLTATATSTGTITSVRFQRSPAGAGTWTEICSDTVAPFTCGFNTAVLADGAYDLRAVVTDSAGKTTSSAVIRDRLIDTTPVHAVDVQTTNGGNPGRIDSGDTIAFTFSERVNLTTLRAGWDGSPVSVNVRVRDGLFILGNSNINNDVLDVTGVSLGTVNLDDNFASVFSLQVDATMTATTVTVNGTHRTIVTLRINETSGNTVNGTGTMVWKPSATVTDLAGNPMSTAPVTESGTADRDF